MIGGVCKLNQPQWDKLSSHKYIKKRHSLLSAFYLKYHFLFMTNNNTEGFIRSPYPVIVVELYKV